MFRPNATGAAADNTETYRINVFAPLLEGASCHLLDRFGLTQCHSLAVSRLVPAYLGGLLRFFDSSGPEQCSCFELH